MEMMEDVTIPGWALGAIFFVLLPWMLYLTKGVHDNQRNNDINNANDKNTAAELQRLYHLLEKMDVKLDSFLAQEFHFMKGMLLKDKEDGRD